MVDRSNEEKRYSRLTEATKAWILQEITNKLQIYHLSREDFYEKSKQN